MIVLIHNKDALVAAFHFETKATIDLMSTSIVDGLFELASRYPKAFIGWCHHDLQPYINVEGFKTICRHQLTMVSYEVRASYYIAELIGYVDSSPFVNVKKDVTYPTWLMSSCIGCVHSEVLSSFDVKNFRNQSFDYVLNSIARQGQPKGLFCYSSPYLLRTNEVALTSVRPSVSTLFKFIKQHYKTRWTFLTFFNSCIYEKKIHLVSFVKSWFVQRKPNQVDFESIQVSSKTSPTKNDYDVIIPTIGRKQYLYDVLKDLGNQTLLPNKVIIIEQNPEANSVSQLDYLEKETWPFNIVHQFIHRTGACYARNLALKKVSSSYVFMADDDIRFESTVIERAFDKMVLYGLKAATLSCLKEGQNEDVLQPVQWHTFGSGCSIVPSEIIKTLSYDLGFEHGFGEDGDFGMQLRYLGIDIGYLPDCNLLHLKAPVGGFRIPYQPVWQSDVLQPKPSPTIMLFNLKHQSLFQLQGYKTILFFKFYKLQHTKNIFTYLTRMRKRWDRSKYWAQQLKNKHR